MMNVVQQPAMLREISLLITYNPTSYGTTMRRRQGSRPLHRDNVSPLTLQRAQFSLTSFSGNGPHGAHVRALRHRQGA
jgi:hypothetical protein